MTQLKICCSIFLQVKKEKQKQDFYRCKEIFTRAVYCKIMFKSVMYVICDKYKFLSSLILVVTQFIKLILHLKVWLLVSSAWPLWWILINVINAKNRSLNIEMELPIYEWNGHVISCSISDPDLLWNCFSSTSA